jgi:hypothetical protein
MVDADVFRRLKQWDRKCNNYVTREYRSPTGCTGTGQRRLHNCSCGTTDIEMFWRYGTIGTITKKGTRSTSWWLVAFVSRQSPSTDAILRMATSTNYRRAHYGQTKNVSRMRVGPTKIWSSLSLFCHKPHWRSPIFQSANGVNLQRKIVAFIPQHASLIFLLLLLKFLMGEDTVACRPAARQRPRNKLDNGHC